MKKNTTATPQINLTDLPLDVIKEIKSHLPVKAIVSLAQVSKFFYKNAKGQEEMATLKKTMEPLITLLLRGNQNQLEAAIKLNPDILKIKVIIKDGDRRFCMTFFQYALWALDRHMWTMMRKYMSDTEAFEQLTEFENMPHAYGKHFNFDPLIKALSDYLNLEKEMKANEPNTRSYAVRQEYYKPLRSFISEHAFPAQRKTVAHVIQHLIDSDPHFFMDRATFKETTFTRCEKVTVSGEYRILKLNWFSDDFPTDVIICRGGLNYGEASDSFPDGEIAKDINSLKRLQDVRNKEYLELKQELELSQSHKLILR